MKKNLLLAFALALLVPWATRAQDCTQTVPYFEGFEGVTGTTSYSTAGSLPSCWNGYSNGTSANYVPHVVTGSNSYCYQYAGSNSLVMTSGSSSYGNTKYVLLPPMDQPLSGLYLTFWMCTESSSMGVLSVGYVTADDTSTFVEIANYPATSATYHGSSNGLIPNKGETVELVLSSVPASATRLAFKWVYNSSFYSCCIDEVHVTLPPTCPKVENLTAVPSVDEAVVSWTEMGSASMWEVTLTDAAGVSVTELVTNNPATLTNLTPNTAYSVTVRSVCGVDDTSQARSTSFRTLCEVIPTDSMPWIYGVEDASGTGSSATFNSCIQKFTNYSTAYPYPSSTQKHSGTYAFYFYSTSSAYSYLTLPMFEDDPSDLYLTFWAYKTSANYGHVYVGVMSNPSDLSTFDTIATLQVGELSTWELMEVSLASYTGTGGVIALLSPNMSAASYVYIDDITVGYPPACLTPSDIVSSNVTASSVDLSWTSAASEFIVEYGLQGFTHGTGTVETVTTNSISLNNLQMGKTYNVYVTAICGDDTSNYLFGSFTTGCAVITSDDLPYIEDFESYGTGSSYPINACWTKGTSSSTAYPYPSSSAAINGNRGLYCYGYYPSSATGTHTYSWVALPPIDESLDMSSLMVTFNAKRYSTTTSYYNSYVYIGIADSLSAFGSADGIDSTVTWIDTVDLTSLSASAVEAEEVSFANYLGTGKYVVFYIPEPPLSGTNTYAYNYIYLDDIALRTIPNCFWPTSVALNGISSDEAIITWTPDPRTSSPSGWTVEYGPHGFTLGEGETTTTSDTTVTLTDLLPNTEYDVYVRADCGGDVSDPAIFSFRTTCIALDTLPWFQDFENEATTSSTSHDFVPCMNLLNNGSQYFGYPYVANSTTYNHTPGGSKGLYWYGSTTTGTYGDYYCVVLPGINTELIPMNTVQLRFWAKSSSTSYNVQFQVGVMTDPTNINSFQLVQNVEVGGNTTYTEYTVALGTYTGAGQYVAIKAVRPSSTWYAYMDDITLELMPDCPAIENIAAYPTVSNALLTWDYQAGYDAPTNYLVTYDSVGGTNPALLSVTTNNVVLSGLAPSTEYKAYVQADCGSDGFGRIDSITFTTGAFDCLGRAETEFSNSNTGISGCIAYSSYGNTVYQALYTAEELAAAGVTAGPITAIDLGFAPSTYNKEFSIYLGSTATTSISNATIEDPSTHTQVYGPASHPAGTEGWQHYEFSTPFVWDGTSNIIMTTFMNQPTGTSQTSSSGLMGYYVSASNRARYRYRDSQQFTLSNLTEGSAGSTYSYRAAIHFYVGNCTGTATCANPNVVVTDVTTGSVDLTWAPGAGETSWDIKYRLLGDTAWTVAATGVNDNNYTITGLADGSDYEFCVSFTCSGTLYHGFATATTNCLPKTLPYTQNFDNITTSTTATNPGVMPNCWDFTMTGSSTYQAQSYWPGVYYHATAYAASGNYCLRLYGIGIFSLPEVSVPLDSLRITFSDTITAASYNGLEVGAIENGVFVPIATVDLATNTRNYVEVMLNNYHGTSRTIALRSSNTSSSTYYSYHYIDDVVIDYIPFCSHINNLAVTATTENSISVSWTPVGAATSWIVSDGTNQVVVVDTNYTFTGLNANTVYEISVFSICGEGDTSEAVSLNARTDCGLIPVPYFEDFESYGTGSTQAISPCWTKGTNSSTAYPYPYSTNAVTGQRSLYFYGYHPSSASTTAIYSYAALPLFQQPVNNLMLNFNVRRYATTTDYYTTRLVIGVMSDPTDISTFEPLDTLDLKNEAASSIHNYEYSFDNYTGTAQYIAIYDEVPPLYGSSTYTYSYAYVDDVTVDVIPTCPRVTNLTASPLLTSATVYWTDNSGNTGWNVEYGTSEFTPGTGVMTPVHVTDTFAVISGLDSATLYHVYVYPDCGTDVFYRHISFNTLAASPATVPYFCGFEAAGLNGWDLINGTQNNQWMVGTATNNGGTQSLYISDDDSTNNYSGTASYVFATRTFNLAAGSYICSFDWKAQGESSFDFLRAAMVPASTVFTAGEYCGFDNTSGMPAGGIALDGAYRLNLQGSSWNTQVTEVSITTPGTYTMVFLWRNDPSVYNQPPAAIDNVSLILNTCPMVENLDAVSAGTNQITVDWTDMAGASEWQVSYSDSANTTVITTTSHPVTISGLANLTTYSFTVRPVCAAGDTGAWCVPVPLSTAICDNAVVASTGAPTGTSYYTPVNNYYHYTLTETIIDSAELAGIGEINTIAYSYAYATASTDKTDVTIWLQPTTKSVFTSSSDLEPLDSSIAVQVYSGDLNCTQGWNYFALDTTYQWDGHSNLLVIVDDNSDDYNGSAYVFNTSACTGYKTIVYYSDSQNPDPTTATYSGSKTYYQYRATMQLISCNAGCNAPQVDTLYAGETTATLNWRGSAATYEVAAMAGNWVDPTVVETATGNTYTVTGLTPGTQYSIGIRSVCGEDVYSEWNVMTVVTAEHPCYAPTALTMTANTISSITIAWTAADADQTTFEIRYSNAGDTTYVTVSENPYEITGLVNGTAYSVAVRAICGEGNYSDWSAPITATTADCGGVTDVRVTPATTTAVVTWTSNATTFELEYGIYGTSRGQGTRVTVTGTTYTIEGLEPETNYQVTVRTKCSETAYSDWSPVLPFETDEVQGIDDVDNAAISLYPNPASSTVTLTGIEGEATVTVVDMNGRENGKWKVESGKLTIDVTGYAQGAYFVRITGERVNAIRKLIVR